MALVVCALAGCGSSNNTGGADAYTPADSNAMDEPCAIMVASTPITGGTSGSGGICTPVLDETSLTINFIAVSDPIDQAMGAIACTITLNEIPQTLGFRGAGSDSTGCSVNINYNNLNGSAASDSWVATATSQVNVTITDLVHIAGTLNIMVDDAMSSPLTVTGTF
jgi:hypothetical protein